METSLPLKFSTPKSMHKLGVCFWSKTRCVHIVNVVLIFGQMQYQIFHNYALFCLAPDFLGKIKLKDYSYGLKSSTAHTVLLICMVDACTSLILKYK